LPCRHRADDAGAGLLPAHLRRSGARRPNGTRKLEPAGPRVGFGQPAPESMVKARVLRRLGRGAPGVRRREQRHARVPCAAQPSGASSSRA
jgi:hypothetical protein